MASSESFGVQSGYGKQVVEWINEYASKNKIDLEARLYNHTIRTQNFGNFEMFSWMGNIKSARRTIVQASKRFHVRVIEGGYKTKEGIFSTTKIDYAMVREGSRIMGKIKFDAPRISRGTWTIREEEVD